VSAAGSDALMLWLHQHGATLRSLAVFYDSMYSLTNYDYMDRLHQLTRLELNDMTERPDLLSSIGIFLTVRRRARYVFDDRMLAYQQLQANTACWDMATSCICCAEMGLPVNQSSGHT
jgi:hypothetical protein